MTELSGGIQIVLRLALWSLVIAVIGAIAAVAYVLNLSPMRDLAGAWEVKLVEYAPPLMKQEWYPEQQFVIGQDGRVAANPSDADLNAFGVVARDICFFECYTMTKLSLDYRLKTQTRYAVVLSRASKRIEILGPAGFRIVANRVPNK